MYKTQGDEIPPEAEKGIVHSALLSKTNVQAHRRSVFQGMEEGELLKFQTPQNIWHLVHVSNWVGSQ